MWSGNRKADRQNARIYIATYPGMMKIMDHFDVGYFDLIIADESHRSIYNVYGDLFKYFDALQIGLTATPIDMVSKTTFGLFGCEGRIPTANYSPKMPSPITIWFPMRLLRTPRNSCAKASNGRS